MNKIKIKVSISNGDAPYFYEGEANEKNDIIEYKYQKEEVVFDKKTERITKINSKMTIIIDFLNKELIIKSKERTFRIDIDVIKKEITDNKYYYVYIINEDEIEFILEKEV